MSLFSWLEGVRTIAFTLIPVFLIWACAVLWAKSRSPWAMVALIGASSGVLGVVAVWLGFLHHYSSLAVMLDEDDHPNLTRQLAITLSVSLGFFITAFGLVGYARSLPK